LVKAIVLVKSPKKLIAAKLKQVNLVYESFPVNGQFDAVALIQVESLSQIKDITTKIQRINGVERTETMIEVQ
jgi:DNA-binding Lrp family transcriptional regulator